MENPQQFQIVTECFKEVHNWGNTVFMNICDGSQSVVPWGAVDWMGGILIAGMLCILLGLVAVLLKPSRY